MTARSMRLCTIVLCLAAILGYHAAARADGRPLARYPLAADGSVRFWMLCLPFANPEAADFHDGSVLALEKDYLAPVGGEANADPSEGEAVPGGVGGTLVKWYGAGFTEQVNLYLHTRAPGVTAYAFCYLDADAETTVTLKLGSSDATKVFLNGDVVLVDPVERAPSPGLASASVKLHAGMNRLLVKSSQARWEWGFYFQVVGDDGRAPAGVRTALPVTPKPITDGDRLSGPTPRPLPGIAAPVYVPVPLANAMTIHVRADRLRDPVKIALDRLTARLEKLGVRAEVSVGPKPAPLADLQLGHGSGGPESFTISSAGGRTTVLGGDDMGIVYGLSFLQSRLWKGQSGARWNLDALSRSYSPEFRKRGIYVMYGYNFHDIEVHDWTIERWRAYIDDLMLARLNTLYIYVWTSEWSAMPGSNGDNPRNRRMHETIRAAIRYAHRRGMKVCHMLTPSLLPSDLYDTKRAAFSDKPTIPGWKFACIAKPGARELMADLIRAELKYFREADSFQIAFFDPGGCLCDSCSKDPAAGLYEQVKLWSAIVRQYHPGASLSMNFWPFKVIEGLYGKPIAEPLMDLARKDFGTGIDICESADLERVYLHTAKAKGFPTTAFIFPTNPETVYFLPIISGSLWKPMLSQMRREWGFDSALFQRMEVGVRGAQDYIMGGLYWDTSADPDRLMYDYACAQIGDSAHGELFAALLKGIDDFTNRGQEPGSRWKADWGASIELGARDLAPWLPADRRWYAGLGPIYAALGRAIYAQDALNSGLNLEWRREIDAQREGFVKAVRSAPLYRDALPHEDYIRTLFDSYTTWLAAGRANTMW